MCSALQRVDIEVITNTRTYYLDFVARPAPMKAHLQHTHYLET
jgi:hypothetical protein